MRGSNSGHGRDQACGESEALRRKRRKDPTAGTSCDKLIINPSSSWNALLQEIPSAGVIECLTHRHVNVIFEAPEEYVEL